MSTRPYIKRGFNGHKHMNAKTITSADGNMITLVSYKTEILRYNKPKNTIEILSAYDCYTGSRTTSRHISLFLRDNQLDCTLYHIRFMQLNYGFEYNLDKKWFFNPYTGEIIEYPDYCTLYRSVCKQIKAHPEHDIKPDYSWGYRQW